MTPVHLLGFDCASRAAQQAARLVCAVDKKHLRRAQDNLRFAFPAWSEDEVRACAAGTFEHLCQLGVEFMYVPRLITRDGCSMHLRFGNIAPAVRALCSDKPVILISGHIGNWELIGYAISMLGFGMHAVYRPLDLRPLDRWMRTTRESKGLTLVSKFGAARDIPAALKPGTPVGLVADQSGGDRGVFVPFFGRLTSTYKMVALLAMQKQATIVCGVARRLPMTSAGASQQARTPSHGAWDSSLARGDVLAEISSPHLASEHGPGLRYSVDVTDVFGPDDWTSQPDPVYYISARYRRAMETMIRAAPEQYFWMHRVWRSRPAHERTGKPFPPQLREKLRSLPWLSEEEVGALVRQSERDTRELASNTLQAAT
jgi:KDO2-lipid IV(A) lauroyltransferase